MRIAMATLAVLFAVGCSAPTATQNPKMDGTDAKCSKTEKGDCKGSCPDSAKKECPKEGKKDGCCPMSQAKAGMKMTPVAAISTLADGTAITFEGKVARVCQKRGCWVEVTDGTNTIMAKSFEHKVLFPLDCAGKNVRVSGVVKHMKAEDHAEKHEDSGEKHECPKPSILVSMTAGKLIE